MSITIQESGMKFGPYEETNVFYVEKSSLYKSLGENVKSVEFILYKSDREIDFIEAKSSSPQPSNQEDFDVFMLEIYEKFAHTIDLFFAILLKRILDDSGEMPSCFYNANSQIDIKLILVINGHKIDWLSPINDAINQQLRRQIKTWNLQVVVMNEQLAHENQLIYA